MDNMLFVGTMEELMERMEDIQECLLDELRSIQDGFYAADAEREQEILETLYGKEVK
jgi:phage gp29-like protein